MPAAEERTGTIATFRKGLANGLTVTLEEGVTFPKETEVRVGPSVPGSPAASFAVRDAVPEEAVADHHGRIKRVCERKGTPAAENDLRVAGLPTEDWTK